MGRKGDLKFIDLHTHILPGVDDGARDMAEALEILRRARQDGTGTVVLTPHYRGRFRRNSVQHLRELFAQLSEAAAREVPDMALYLGHEAGNEHELSEKLLSGQVLTLMGTRYVLLEFDEYCYRSNVLSSIFDIVNSGFIPIIAHVERYEIFRKCANLAEEAVSMGAQLQINAGSVLGCHGLGVKLYCGKLLRRKLVRFVASDAHDAEKRPPTLGTCYDRICRRYGETYARALFCENARKILDEMEQV